MRLPRIRPAFRHKRTPTGRPTERREQKAHLLYGTRAEHDWTALCGLSVDGELLKTALPEFGGTYYTLCQSCELRWNEIIRMVKEDAQ